MHRRDLLQTNHIGCYSSHSLLLRRMCCGDGSLLHPPRGAEVAAVCSPSPAAHGAGLKSHTWPLLPWAAARPLVLSFLLSLELTLLGPCPAHVRLRGQPEIWAKFILRMWGSSPRLLSFSCGGRRVLVLVVAVQCGLDGALTSG